MSTEAQYDQEELADRFEALDCDVTDIHRLECNICFVLNFNWLCFFSVLKVLVEKTENTVLERSFLGLCQSLLTLGLDEETGLKSWLCAEKLGKEKKK